MQGPMKVTRLMLKEAALRDCFNELASAKVEMAQARAAGDDALLDQWYREVSKLRTEIRQRQDDLDTLARE